MKVPVGPPGGGPGNAGGIDVEFDDITTGGELSGD
jgi:hypothetical protein